MKKFIFRGLLLSIVAFAGCIDEAPIIEVPETTDNTQASLAVLSEVLSTFDIIQDLTSRNEFFMKKDASLLPNDVLYIPLDTSYTDGDGIELLLDFGDLGKTPYGLLCKDEKYRAGKIKLSLSKPYTEIDAILKIEFLATHPFYSGDGSVMNKLGGVLSLSRVSDDEVRLQSSKLTVEKEDVLREVFTDLSIHSIKDNGIGLLNDELSFSGEISVTYGELQTTLVTKEPLEKHYTLACAKHIVKGIFDVNQSNSASEIEVDFDPDNDAACDNKVAILINGKRVMYHY
ncbi:MAG: hypothetical protein COA58_00900 [Bacteroidetes bacterium]|nr:MAG: hypothetical protein COA58_00900 [Bacteroidota bacterium]